MSLAMKVERSAAIASAVGRRGYRLTGPRRAVLDVLAGAGEPMTVAAIHAALRPRRANVVSVYRTVNLLAGLGVLRLTPGVSSRQPARYELGEPFAGHHHHLVCQGCGRIEDVAGCLIPADDLARMSQRMRRTRRFRVTEHDLRLLGMCGTCEQ
jgi:Fur family ferric uptake transcriptional regulator